MDHPRDHAVAGSDAARRANGRRRNVPLRGGRDPKRAARAERQDEQLAAAASLAPDDREDDDGLRCVRDAPQR
jgi:hypothetical protein